jgi:hypothetical protein
MATLATEAEVERAIYDAIASYNVRAGEIVPRTAIQMKLDQQGIRAVEFHKAEQSMIDKGEIEIARDGAFIKLTEAGFDKM